MKNPKPVTSDAIPAALIPIDHWVAYQVVPKPNGKMDKLPYSAHTGLLCSVTDASNYAAFDVALAFQMANRDRFHGIGFCLTKEISISGIDLDDSFDMHGQLKPWAADILSLLPKETYVEITPSGSGLRNFYAESCHPAGASENYRLVKALKFMIRIGS